MGFYQGLGMSLEDVLNMEARNQAIAARTPDRAEGVAIFREKRRRASPGGQGPVRSRERAARRAGLPRSHLVRGADAPIVTVRHLERFSPTARSAARIYGRQPLLIGIQGRLDVVDKLKAALGQALDLAS
jgi:hypothetical protein